MINTRRTDSENTDFQALVVLLDKELHLRDGVDHSFYAQFNKIDKIKYAVVAYLDKEPVGIGALRQFGPDSMEVKRMFVLPACRGQGIAREVLAALEAWAGELNFTKCILETGKKQTEAIQLYQTAGYTIIQNYGQYENVENSVCMAKQIVSSTVN